MGSAVRRVVPAATAVGLVAGLIGGWRIWVPSYWYDEAATISSTTRDPQQLLDLVRHVDAVHGAYYAVLDLWFRVVGISEFTARVPSAVAVAMAAAVLVVAVSDHADLRTGVIAGVLFAVLPRVLWASTEARSYALVLCAAVLLTWVLGRRWWIAYAVIAAVAMVLFLYLALLVIAQLVVVALVWRPQLRRAVVSAGCAVLVASPALVFIVTESGQVSWIPPIDGHIWRMVFVEQFFPEAPAVAAMVWALFAVGVIARRREPLAGLALVTAILPTALLIGYSLTRTSSYVDRYVIFSTPGVAIGAALGVMTIARHWMHAVIVVLIAACAVPAYWRQRTEYGKSGGSDFSAIADYLGAEARPGDCAVFQDPLSWSPVGYQLVAEARPEVFDHLRLPGAGESRLASAELWDAELPPEATADRAADCSTVWLVTDGERDSSFSVLQSANVYWRFEVFHVADSPLYRALAAQGFTPVRRASFLRGQVIELQR